MRFYHIQPSELEKLDNDTKLGLYLMITKIKARESLEFMMKTSAMFDKDAATMMIYKLLDEAFPGESKLHIMGQINAIASQMEAKQNQDMNSLMRRTKWR